MLRWLETEDSDLVKIMISVKVVIICNIRYIYQSNIISIPLHLINVFKNWNVVNKFHSRQLKYLELYKELINKYPIT